MIDIVENIYRFSRIYDENIKNVIGRGENIKRIVRPKKE